MTESKPSAETEALREEISAAVDDYRRVFPEPCALSPNLGLAVRALALIPDPPTEDEKDQESV